MIEDDEEGRRSSGPPLEPGAGNDVPHADRLVGGDPVREVGAHGGAELPLEARGPEGENAADVGVEPVVVEGGHGHGKAADEGDVVGGGVWEPVMPGGADHFEGEGDHEQSDSGAGDPRVGGEGPTGGGDVGREIGGDRRSVPPEVRAIWVVAAVLVVLALALGGYLLGRGGGASGRQSAVKRFSEKFAMALSSYDYHHLEGDLAKVRSLGVSRFSYDYAAVQHGSSFEKALTNNQAVATAKITSGPFVAALGKNDARTFTVLQQTIRGKSSPQPETRRVRVETFLVRTPSGWRVDWVEIT